MKSLNLTGMQIPDHYHRLGFQFCYAKVQKDTVEVLHIPTSCKDYMTDTLVWTEEGKDERLYGGFWSFLGPIDQNHTTVALLVPRTLLKNLKFFRKYERSLGIEPLKVFGVRGYSESAFIVVQADKFWQTTTIHLSLFLSWLRNLATTVEVKSLVDPTGNCQFITMHLSKILALPTALQKLKVSIKRNSPSQRGMHSLNGHHSMLTLPLKVRESLTYGKQLEEIAPELLFQDVWVEYPTKPIPIYGLGAT